MSGRVGRMVVVGMLAVSSLSVIVGCRSSHPELQTSSSATAPESSPHTSGTGSVPSPTPTSSSPSDTTLVPSPSPPPTCTGCGHDGDVSLAPSATPRTTPDAPEVTPPDST